MGLLAEGLQAFGPLVEFDSHRGERCTRRGSSSPDAADVLPLRCRRGHDSRFRGGVYQRFGRRRREQAKVVSDRQREDQRIFVVGLFDSFPHPACIRAVRHDALYVDIHAELLARDELESRELPKCILVRGVCCIPVGVARMAQRNCAISRGTTLCVDADVFV